MVKKEHKGETASVQETKAVSPGMTGKEKGLPTARGYFLRFVLLALPGINGAAALIWAFGSQSREKRNFGRGALFFLLLLVLLGLAAGLTGLYTLGGLLESLAVPA